MRLASVWLLPLLFALTAAQFGGFGGSFNKVTNSVQQGFGNLGSKLKLPSLLNVNTFSEFAELTGKTYAEGERQLREGIFAARRQLVNLHNAGSKGYELAINAFADLTNAEFIKKLTGNKKSSRGEAKASVDREEAAPPTTNVPDAFDWRSKGGVTPVKYQGDCGSCWTFATTGAIEGHTFRATGKLPTLSEQNLVDCGPIDYGLNGCDGGFQEYAFAFIKDVQKGVAPSDKYPYLDKKDTCKYDPATKAALVKGFAAIKPKDEKTMKEVVATLGPLACSVNALETLLLYKKGIYADEECNKGEVNHAILVVGYGSENGQDYWIVKNSWDKTWGEEGYFRLPRGCNFCGIADECSYPIV
ncbi:procathepsin L [Anastrepha obliqua]|uniref:procathepsin L n=1 Tax=Anastrepha ludens TaxID=28586 RepID=UPI0023AF8E4A|nr:procathepsin L [Anastrepha ludens]XP_054739923.1 procathepsin L [Anastrepha obliqua]